MPRISETSHRYLQHYMEPYVRESKEQRSKRLNREKEIIKETAEQIVENLVMKKHLSDAREYLASQPSNFPEMIRSLNYGYAAGVISCEGERPISSAGPWKFTDTAETIIQADCLKFYSDGHDLIASLIENPRIRNARAQIGTWFCETRNFGGYPFRRLAEQHLEHVDIKLADQLHRLSLQFKRQTFTFQAPIIRVKMEPGND